MRFEINKPLKSVARKWLPRSIRTQRILAGPLRGYRIVTSWYDYPAAILGRTEKFLLDWSEKNVSSGETWLDIGAHYGYTAIALSRLVGLQERVFAFEPMVSTAEYLTQPRRLNDFPQLRIVPMALAAPDTLELRQLPTVRGMVDSGKQGAEGLETILVMRPDWLWPRICGCQETIDGVKIDVQGMEVDALRGMVETLRRYRPKLVVEVHHGVNRTQLLGIVESVGYSRQAVPIEPIEGEVEAQYIDDRSYAFPPGEKFLCPGC